MLGRKSKNRHEVNVLNEEWCNLYMKVTHITCYTPACTEAPVCPTALCSQEKIYNNNIEFIVQVWRNHCDSVCQRIQQLGYISVMLVTELTHCNTEVYYMCVCVCYYFMSGWKAWISSHCVSGLHSFQAAPPLLLLLQVCYLFITTAGGLH